MKALDDTLTFLVVEDSPTMRQLIAFSLKRFKKANIVEAKDGIDALKKLANTAIDMIVTDINIPGIDGLKLVKKIRSDQKFNHLPIVIITSKGQEEDRKRGLALGADAYVAKPIQSRQLIRVISKLFQDHQ